MRAPETQLTQEWQTIMGYLPIMLPLMILQFALLITALIHIFTHEHYRIGNRVFWAFVVICFNTFGPILYFILGRGEPKEKDE